MQRASLRAFNRTKHLDLVCSSHPAPLLSQRTWPFEAALAGLASLAGSGLSLSTPTCLAQLSSSLLSPTNETAYHAFIFFIPPLFRKATFRVPAAARAARSRWLDAVSAAPRDSATQTYAVQSIRNSIMAASFTASTCGLIAVSGLLPAILDGAKVGRLRELAELDPISRALLRSSSEKEKAAQPRWPSVEFKLSVMVRATLSSFLLF